MSRVNGPFKSTSSPSKDEQPMSLGDRTKPEGAAFHVRVVRLHDLESRPGSLVRSVLLAVWCSLRIALGVLWLFTRFALRVAWLICRLCLVALAKSSESLVHAIVERFRL